MRKNCACGRIWELADQHFNDRDPGAIICQCGEEIVRWRGATTWTAELVQGLPEDEGRPRPCRYE
jgi:hypothetical protein